MSDPFGFKVFYKTASSFRPDWYPASWDVTLPHQCEDWIITRWPESYEDDRVAPSKEEAILDLSQFIDEAKEALAWLIAQPAKPEGPLEWTAEIDDG